MSTAPRPSKHDRREEARAAALALREKQEREARKRRTLAIGLGVAGVAVVAVLVGFIVTQGGGGGGAEVRPVASSERGGIVLDAGGLVTPPADADETWPQGAFGEDVVVVSVYSDFMCPFCSLFEESNGALLEELRQAGEVVLDVHPVAILDRYSNGTAFSTRSAGAAFAVAELSPEAFVEFNATMFANQPAENTDGLSDEQVAAFATAAGASDETVAAITDGTYRWWAAQATERASQDLGSLSTPTILLDGAQLDAAVDWRVDGALAAAIEAARG